jgi:hypothetical protein
MTTANVKAKAMLRAVAVVRGRRRMAMMMKTRRRKKKAGEEEKEAGKGRRFPCLTQMGTSVMVLVLVQGLLVAVHAAGRKLLKSRGVGHYWDMVENADSFLSSSASFGDGF